MTSPLKSLIIVATIVSPIAASAQSARYYEQTYMPASHNWVFRRTYPQADRLFNAFDYGHAILYQTLWTEPDAKAEELDSKQFGFITRKLFVHPPSVMLDETAIGPDWAKLAPETLRIFEWAHMLHRQIYDIWADDRIPDSQKDAKVKEVIDYYKSRPVLALSSRPKHMDLMEGMPYSLAFRKRFPTFNGLIWSYHWMQMTLYDALLAGTTKADRTANVNLVVKEFKEMSADPSKLPSTMPMSAVIAPRFTRRYTEAAIIFDNLHSLHDVVSDILANPSVPRSEKRRRILDATASYRDDKTQITSVGEWAEMAGMMGADKMGGIPSFSDRKDRR
jgi:hypothetical protein